MRAADCDATGSDKVAQTKMALRHALLSRRRTVDANARNAAGRSLAQHAEELTAGLPRHATIATYISMGTEIPTDSLATRLLGSGFRLLVPQLGSGRELGWGVLDDMSSWNTMTDKPTLPAKELASAALILIPALAVDPTGTRLGRGAGWYDRAVLHSRHGTPIIAICWPWERVRTPLPKDVHDMPVQAVVSTDGLEWIASD